MAVDIAPFDDPLIRQAFRLIANRQQLIDTALLGFGSVANDLPRKGLWNFAADLPPAAGTPSRRRRSGAGRQENLEVTLHTSEIVPGFVEARRCSPSERRRWA
jgi:peptide/nickel transport system substrate-binding protein